MSSAAALTAESGYRVRPLDGYSESFLGTHGGGYSYPTSGTVERVYGAPASYVQAYPSPSYYSAANTYGGVGARNVSAVAAQPWAYADEYLDPLAITSQYNVDRQIYKKEDAVLRRRPYPSFAKPTEAFPAGPLEEEEEELELGLGYKSPYTGKRLKAPIVPSTWNNNPTAHLAHMSTFWTDSTTGHPISSKKRERRLNTILAMFEDMQVQHQREQQAGARGLGSLLTSFGSFFSTLLSPAYPAHSSPPLLPSGPVKEWTPITGKRKALLIGINYTGQKGQLRGCANDVLEMEAYVKRRGYNDIQKLVDDGTNSGLAPTRANILNAIQWLVSGAQAGDSLFFHYSGHGGQQADTSGDEADGKDETIVPVDYREAGQITDDTLGERLCIPLPNGCRLTSVMDCCHSGTGLDLPYVKTAQGSGLQCEYKDSRLTGEIILFSGCRDDQTSADVKVGDMGYGAMTKSFLGALAETSNQTYNHLLESMRQKIKQGRYTQVPQLSLSKNLNLDALFSL